LAAGRRYGGAELRAFLVELRAQSAAVDANLCLRKHSLRRELERRYGLQRSLRTVSEAASIRVDLIDFLGVDVDAERRGGPGYVRSVLVRTAVEADEARLSRDAAALAPRSWHARPLSACSSRL